MIKVLLVDDEKLALEYLEHIIDWEYHGFELIGVTTNPEQAMQFANMVEIHIFCSFQHIKILIM